MPQLYWYRLIDTLKTHQLINIGPTIPYLIGARRHNDSKFSSISNEVQTLLTEMEDSEDEYIGIIQYCDTIQQVVIGVCPSATIDEQFNFAVKATNKQGRISLISTLDRDKYGNTMIEVAKSLATIYSNPIKAHNYSWDPLFEEWGPIFKNELAIIEQVEVL